MSSLGGLWSALTNYWVLEFLVVLVASVVSIVVVELISERRKRAKVRITPYARGNLIGFKIEVRGGTLLSPKVVYNIPENEEDSFPCDIYNFYMDPWKRDYILAGETVLVFPLLADSKWRKDENGSSVLEVSVEETNPSKFPREVLGFRPVKRPDGRTFGKLMPDPKSYYEGGFDVALRVYAQGWGDDEIHLFGLRIQPHIWPPAGFSDSPAEPPPPPVEKWNIFYEVSDQGPQKKGSRRLIFPE